MNITARHKEYIKGSKVPVIIFFDYIRSGYSLTEFLSAYPWLKRTNVEKTLEEIKAKIPSGYAF